MKKIMINGMFLSQQISGVQRNAIELLKELDKISLSNNIELIIPKNANVNLVLNNIKTIKIGYFKDRLWEQISFLNYLIKNKGIALNLCNTAPLLKPGIVMICDVIFKHKNDFPQEASRLSKYISRDIQTRIICKFSKKILTISKFSESEIKKYYGVSSRKIEIIPCAWQHYSRIETNEMTLNKYGLKMKSYFFAMSNIAKHKNFEWIIRSAKHNPNCEFVISGSYNKRHFHQDLDIRNLKNIKYIGFVEDSVAKTLMSNSKAFISPSFYEGFGIPPLEALSVGVPVIVSDIPVYHEVLEDCAFYVDPKQFDLDLNRITFKLKDSVLGKYSWERSARQMYSILCENGDFYENINS